jgi:hypothetical protein
MKKSRGGGVARKGMGQKCKADTENRRQSSLVHRVETGTNQSPLGAGSQRAVEIMMSHTILRCPSVFIGLDDLSP